jgi:tetratricopeptide (TPR) repeat protein
MGRQIVWMVGVGLVLVLGFFFATQWSQQYDWGGGEAEQSAAATGGAGGATGASPQSGPAAGPSGSAGDAAQPSTTDLQTLVDELSGPVEGPVADKIDSLRAAEGEAQGERRRQLRAQLVRLYIGAGAPGQAALVQRQLADATGSTDDRRRFADLLYRWMRQVEQQGDRARVAEVARHVASAYEAVANERPQDLDARTRMGEAYLLTNNPMKGIRAINNVLGDDSTFVPARFQKGLALLQINRLDQAIQEFRAVQEYADPQEPFYKQAERAIEVINEQRSSSSDSAPDTP